MSRSSGLCWQTLKYLIKSHTRCSLSPSSTLSFEAIPPSYTIIKMKYFECCWLLIVVLLFVSSQNALAAPKGKRKGFSFPKLPHVNINIHHNNIHIG
ncbi:uncharacterized protein LOC108025370 [Drosophila biarmipes]|uniref:uncharacterized protein LOC108025370 n=1 Tax=Drosophila biarmipes TaxID=125945 RepID=UPI0007E7EE85|nr:uncharacterized protein LOC108025370 [Drosophila biarmipes]